MLSVRIIDLVGFFLVGPCRTALPESRRDKHLKMEILSNSICGRNKISSHYSHMDWMPACRIGQDGPTINAST